MSTSQRRLSQYDLQQRVADDALGEVWTAFDTQQRRYVFLKILHVNPQASPDFVPRFLQETRSLLSLQHPGIVQVLNIQASQAPDGGGSQAYIVTEYVEGSSLAEYLAATSHRGQFPAPVEIVRLLTFVGSALDYAHQHGIIHGDIKPDNILFDRHRTASFPGGEPRLTGFGVNTLPRPLSPSINDVSYIAPEVAQGQAPSERSDLYSLGVILYELCTGTLPFQGETASDVMMQHIRATPTSPVLINPHILPGLTAAILRALAKDPAARFPTASALVVAVARAFTISTQDIVSQSGSWIGTNVRPPAPSGTSADHQPGQARLTPVPPSQLSGPIPPMTGGASGSLPVQSPYAVSSLSPAQTPSLPGNSMPLPTVHPQFSEMDMPTLRSQSNPGISGAGYSYAGAQPAQSAQPAQPVQPTQAVTHSSLPPAPSFTPKKRGSSRLYIGIIAVVILALLASAAGFWLWNTRHTTPLVPQQTLLGHAFFSSSGQLNPNSTQGIADRLQIDLSNVPNPQSAKSYYFWLLSDNAANSINAQPILLGSASNGGRIDITYPGDAQHDNLLASYSRLLVTEEDSGTAPSNPSLDPTTWRYYAAFSQTPNPQDPEHFSLLNHLRHLLAQDPKLKAAGLTGGLDIWLFRNTMKILEWAGSARDARDSGDVDLARRQIVRILDYLDGSQFVQTENLPPDLQPMLVDPVIARVAILNFSPSQTPPGYLKHIGTHLGEISVAPGVTPEQQALAIRINRAIDNTQVWFNAVHSDAEKLIHMSRAQLAQPDAIPIFDDMFTQANTAFVGQIDPNTNQVKEGVVEIHYAIQNLATFDIAPCKLSDSQQSCV
jgi:serine/threonine protein kinase